MLMGLTVGIASISYGFVAEGQPTLLYIIFGAVALLGTLGDIRVLTRGIQGAHRIARHLWRMCVALFLAAISLFIGQSQVFPEPLRNSGLLPIPVLLVLLLMFYWLSAYCSRNGSQGQIDRINYCSNPLMKRLGSASYGKSPIPMQILKQYL